MHFLRIKDFDEETLNLILDRGLELKVKSKKGESIGTPCQGKVMTLLFEKASTRTRLSFEAGFKKLGGKTVFLSGADSQAGRGEPYKDTARVMSSYVDIIVIRTFSHDGLEEFSKYSSVPVINGLTDLRHPCQIVADLLTVKEVKSDIFNQKYVWIGDGNNMANSWIEAAGLLGLNLTLACPKGYEPDKDILEEAQNGKGNIVLTDDPKVALKDATVISTDVWASMGQEEEQKEREKVFKDFQINNKALDLASNDAMVLHCLPAHRGEEITEEVLEGEQSYVWLEAENRLYAQMAVIEKLLIK